MRSHPTRPVEASLDMRLIVPGHAPLHIPAVLSYDPADPYAVTLELSTGTDRGMVAWVFARQLLLDGVTKATGEGDVHVWPVFTGRIPVTFLSLSSPSGSALFEVDMPGLVDFLTRTVALVPAGCESDHVNLDAELAALLT